MAVAFNPATIDFSALAGIGQNIGGAIGQHNLSTAMRDSGAIGADGTLDYNKMVAVLAERRPELAAKLVASQQDTSGIYGTPIFTSQPGPDGKYDTADDEMGIAALGKNGGLIPQSLPGGGRVLDTKKFVDQGTHITPYGTRSGLPSGPSIPIDIHGKESAQQAGAIEGKAAGAMPDVVQNINSSLNAIDEALAHPGRGAATGKSSWMDPSNYIKGSEAYGYREGVLKKVTGQAFLASVQQMRGLGHLSESEGKAATEASAALATGLPDEEHEKQLKILKAIQMRGLIRAYEKSGMDIPPEVSGLWNQAEQDAGLQQHIPFLSGPQGGANITSAPLGAGAPPPQTPELAAEMAGGGYGKQPKQATPADLNRLKAAIARKPHEQKAIEEAFDRLIGQPGSADFYLRGSR
jgi:hypothetical protein